MATINFLYRSTKEKGTLTARLLYRINGKDYAIGTKTKVEVEKLYWIKYHFQKKPKDIEVANYQIELLKELNKIENHILTSFNTTNPSSINKQWLTKVVEDYYSPKGSLNYPEVLTEYIDIYKELKKNEITNNSIKKLNVIKQLVIRYEESRNIKLVIKNIDLYFKRDFENYCLENHYAHNTIARAIRFIKTICKNAQSHGLETNYQLDSIKTKYVKIQPIYLSEEDIEKIEKIDLNSRLDTARDWLLISCYTGQRISDFMRFKKEMIRIEDTKKFIDFTQIKTNKIMTLPLHKKVEHILKKRKGEFPPRISDQKYNAYIKEVCKLALINQKIKGTKMVKKEEKQYRKEEGLYEKWELITSHIGRRSFASNFYGKIPTSLLIAATGHSTEAMFLNYIGKSDTEKARQLADYF
ncbi:tyrosine-type recombinase/integrase [Flavobacterium rakeshii]|uniref:tyrosine-type recombinase/integrase n=1 Tax=Flavobacterium rakeshii TaxID=1038845 RepID=UPI002E7BF124|nr:tyrosine-type recombinase/integrase [Flavobacterium rakeshii]MEE1897970.1 tyrosine-type recombinase/integrase [Flavobacterium rakeshii]